MPQTDGWADDPEAREDLRPFAEWLNAQIGDTPLNEIERKARRRGIKLLAQSLSRWRRALEFPRLEGVRRLAIYFGVDAGVVEAMRPAGESDPDFVPLYVVDDAALSAGLANGVLAGTLIGQYRVDNPFERGHRFLLIQVRGNCMAPLIDSGDWVVVNATRRNDWRPGELVALSHDGGLLVKRARGAVELPVFVADDGTEVRPDGETRVLGVVVEIRKKP